VRMAGKAAGLNIEFHGEGDAEYAVDRETRKTVVRVNPRFYRPAEVELLIGSAEKAREKLGWQPQTSLEQLCAMMVEADMRRNKLGISF